MYSTTVRIGRWSASSLSSAHCGERAHGRLAPVDDTPAAGSVFPCRFVSSAAQHGPDRARRRRRAARPAAPPCGSRRVADTGVPSSSCTAQVKLPPTPRRTVATRPGRSSGCPFSRTAPTCSRQGQDPVRAGLEQAHGLEAQLHQPRSGQHRAVHLWRQVGGEPGGRAVAVPPRRARRPDRRDRGSTAGRPAPGPVPGCRRAPASSPATVGGSRVSRTEPVKWTVCCGARRRRAPRARPTGDTRRPGRRRPGEATR